MITATTTATAAVATFSCPLQTAVAAKLLILEWMAVLHFAWSYVGFIVTVNCMSWFLQLRYLMC